jgi:hypothetical protein
MKNQNGTNNTIQKNFTKNENFDRNYLISLVIICVLGCILGIFQPPQRSDALNFNTTGSFGGSFGSNGDKLIRAIKTEIRGTSTSAGGTVSSASQNNGGSSSQKRTTAKTDGLNKSTADLKIGHRIFLTSYNPQKSQTDNSPCIGASGINQCNSGERMIALSQDLVGRSKSKPYHYGEYVWLTGETSDQRCNGKFLVVDTMNKRYKLRGDLFFMNRKQNTSCFVKISKL